MNLHQPFPPPLGPRTLKQTELDNAILINEAVQTFTEQVLDFIQQDDEETLDDTIAKLEAFKKMLEPESDEKESKFEELIQMVKTAKKAIDNLNKNHDELDEDYYDDLRPDDDLPRHYWGGEDGNELIFEDDECQSA